MADLWIKARADLADGAKVGRLLSSIEKREGFARWIGRKRQRRRLVAFALLEVWSWARIHGRREEADQLVDGACLEDLDEIAGLDGFGEDLAALPWVVVEPTGLRFPNFGEWNAPRSSAERSRDLRKAKRARSPSNSMGCSANERTIEREGEREGEPSLPSRDLEASLIGFGRFSTAKDLAREIFTRCGLLTVSAFDALPKWDRVFLVKVAALFELRELPEAVLHEAIESVRVNKPKGDKLAYFRKCLHNSRYGNGREWLEDLIARVKFEGSEDF